MKRTFSMGSRLEEGGWVFFAEGWCSCVEGRCVVLQLECGVARAWSANELQLARRTQLKEQEFSHDYGRRVYSRCAQSS